MGLRAVKPECLALMRGELSCLSSMDVYRMPQFVVQSLRQVLMKTAEHLKPRLSYLRWLLAALNLAYLRHLDSWGPLWHRIRYMNS